MEHANRQTGMSRRNFLAGAGLATLAGAGALAGCAPSQPSASLSQTGSASSGVPETWDYDVDVIVVGAGGAGFMAACAAAEEGADTLLLEKADTVGGDTFVCGCITIGPWPEKTKEDSGMDDTLEGWLEDQKKSHEFSQRALNGEPVSDDLSFIERFAELMPGTFEWTRDVAGMEWQSIYYCHNCFSPQPTWDSVFPRDWSPTQRIIPPLEQTAGTFDNLETVTGLGAVELIADESGRIVGLWAEDSVGRRTSARAKKGVVLTTGTFCNNREMMANSMGPDMIATYTTSVSSNMGDGVRMVERIGGAARDMNLGCHWSPNNLTAGALPTYTSSEAMHGVAPIYDSFMPGILVNTDGVRYVNENNGYSLTGLATFQQDFHLGWYVVDANNTAVVIPEDPTTELFATADTLEGLASCMMVRDPAAFAAEVAKYNRFVEAGKDDDFGKALDGCPKIEAAPFYAVPIRPVPYQAYGGIAVDVDGHVLDVSDAPIPGLYAAGICTGSFAAQAGLFYLGGVSQALAFGRQAGKNAAAEEGIA